MTSDPSERLEYLRGELRAERISYGDLAELQSLAEHIDPSDVELREAVGLPEHDDEAERKAELRRAVIRAHEMYDRSHYSDDLEVANYDDEDSFVEKVDGGFWVEARVWVPGDEVEGYVE